ncbi:MAG: hypothetical protein OXG78_00225 [Chloroflexi bacterium]|nr:hypothetical protein [Chloroflexota bacterium]
MSGQAKDQHQELRKSRHGIATAAGIAFFIAFGLVARNDLLFGLVMATIFSSGLGIGRRISTQIADNAPSENLMPAKIIGPLAGAVVVGIITALILSAIQNAVDVSPMEGDDIIATIVKSFFDSTAALAVAAGVIVGGWVHGMASD